MKKVIDIGKEGNQNLTIKALDVSRHHAVLTIEDGLWTLEDNNSTNGTFVQDEEGNFIRVKKMVINEFSRIALGSTTAMGFVFIAHHLIEEDKTNYVKEMEHVIMQYYKMQQELETIESDKKKKMMIRNIPPVLSAFVGTLVAIFFPKIRILALVLMTLVTSVLGALVNTRQIKDSRLKNFSKKQQLIIRCPNCDKPLTESEIEKQKCSKCNAHT